MRTTCTNTSIDDVVEFNFKNFPDNSGILVPVEFKLDVPFYVERVFYVYDFAKDCVRAKHAHIESLQIIVCLFGEVELKVNDCTREKKILLNRPFKAVYIPRMIWVEMTSMQNNSIILCLTNTHYDKLDYIINYEEFVSCKRKY
jgi:dTDP-4-dehydrorhamnose 3,5-epimerase-like enzyme